MTLSEADLAALQTAKNILENPGLTAQLTAYVGTPIEAALKRLPARITDKLGDSLEAALLNVAKGASRTLHDRAGAAPHNRLHMLGAAVSGGVGGFFGPWSMLVEVPVTTGIMFRSIADIARSNGESVKDADTLLACVEVFGLGGKSQLDDASESAYYAVRLALAQQVKAAVEFLAKRGADHTAPVLVALIQRVVERLGVLYTEKLAAQMVPVIGAVGGATINTIFLNHFQSMAKGHFALRQLERQYGREAVEVVYRSLPRRG